MSFRSAKLLKAANGQSCVLCGSVGSTVAAHANSVALGKGTGIKSPDFYAVHFCQEHHDLYDGRRPGWNKQQKEEMWHLAFVRTIARLFDQGIVVVK